MRYVPISCVREGMILGKTLYGSNNQKLLTSGIVLTSAYIRRIAELKINGLYIEDHLSKDISIVEFISDELRQKSLKDIKQVFISSSFEKSKSKTIKPKKSIVSTRILVENIVDEILINKNAMVNIIDLKVFDEYTYYHSVSVTVLSIVLGTALGLPREELYKLGLSAIMHDIGKVFIPKEILNKPGTLSLEEFKVMKTHSEVGYKYIKDGYDVPIKSYVGILQHHEKYCGGGYPDGRTQEDISLFGRIISICDVYDALTSDRPYRKCMIPSEAMEYIMAGSGTMFDPKLVKVFMRKIAPYPIGTCIELSNKSKGIVVENYEDYCMRPKIRIYEENNTETKPYIIDLFNPAYNNVTIVGIIENNMIKCSV